MSLAKLLNRPCVVTHRTASGKSDVYGNELPATEDTDTVCEVQQTSTAEQGAEGEVGDAGWLGIFPAETTLSTADTVEVDGIGAFEVIGEPWPARNPRTQTASHVEVRLRRTVGGEEGS